MTGGHRSEQHRRRGPPPERGERDQGPPAPQAAQSWVRQVIEQGDYRLLDRKARELGQQIGDEATRTQVRAIFGTVRRLDALTGEPRRRELAMLRPRLAYAAARSERLRRIRDVLTEASEVAEERPEERALRVVDLVEAILCYALGARSEREAPPQRGPRPQRAAAPSPGGQQPPAGADAAPSPDREEHSAGADAAPSPDREEHSAGADAAPSPDGEAPSADHDASIKEP